MLYRHENPCKAEPKPDVYTQVLCRRRSMPKSECAMRLEGEAVLVVVVLFEVHTHLVILLAFAFLG